MGQKTQAEQPNSTTRIDDSPEMALIQQKYARKQPISEEEKADWQNYWNAKAGIKTAKSQPAKVENTTETEVTSEKETELEVPLPRVLRNGDEKEFEDARQKLYKYRVANEMTSKRQQGKNLGFLEGTVENGEKTIVLDLNTTITKSYDADKNGLEFPEILQGAKGFKGHSEWHMLNHLAHSLGAVKGGVYPNVKGELKIVSEITYCDSYDPMVRKDFTDMFPNLNVIFIDGIRKDTKDLIIFDNTKP